MTVFSIPYHYVRNGLSAFLNAVNVTRIRYSSHNKQERLNSEAQRLVHQIEKGLSVEKPKKGFGFEKIRKLLNYLRTPTGNCRENEEIRRRVVNCIICYFDYYDTNGWNSSEIDELKKSFFSLITSFEKDPSYGGLLQLSKTCHEDSVYQVLDQIGSSRHSIRDFSNDTVDVAQIKKAVEFAQKAPSACNRQAVRCYVIDKSKFDCCGKWLNNIGFFGEYGFDKILLITCKLTGYNENEGLQHLVSPGIFVGYLVLALEALNIGACIMQRSIYYDKTWNSARKILDIPEDEQSFCLVGVGVKKEKYKVPVSKRLPLEVIMREIK